ncbi:MAG TPA: hypothetical protein DIW36_00335 [Ruminococcaceae bacterium]|nr:hypothetical protein [Oscillospiraceae bacterium]
MLLLISLFAAVISTAVWYSSEKARRMKVGALCWMFWGASVMWFVDAVFEFAELKAEYFTPSIPDMVNDSFLGLSVVALAMTVWIIILLIKDPDKIIRKK